jgi:hypothetical protein
LLDHILKKLSFSAGELEIPVSRKRLGITWLRSLDLTMSKSQFPEKETEFYVVKKLSFTWLSSFDLTMSKKQGSLDELGMTG